jgi:anaerobic C4-dicarboxylate transporter
MGRAARSVLIRTSPVLWAASVALVVLRNTDHRFAHDYLDIIIICCALALAGTLCAAIDSIRDRVVMTLAGSLADATRPPGPTRTHLARAK